MRFYMLFFLMVAQYQAVNAAIHRADYSDLTSTNQSAIFIDTRPQQLCQAETIAKSLCLSINEFLLDDGSIASFHHIFWVLATANIDSKSTLYLVGDGSLEQYAMAALMHIAGQDDVVVMQTVLNDNQLFLSTGAGRFRSSQRNEYYSGQFRDEFLLTSAELARYEREGWQRILIKNQYQLDLNAGVGSKVVITATRLDFALAALASSLIAGNREVKIFIDPVEG